MCQAATFRGDFCYSELLLLQIIELEKQWILQTLVLHKAVCGPPQQEFTLQPMPHQILLFNPLHCIVDCIVLYCRLYA